MFLSQVIHANPTLAATVEGFLAWRLAQEMPPCSVDTGGYAKARRRLGVDDHVVEWVRPARPEWMSPKQYATIPLRLSIREFRYRVVRPGYRTRTIVVATTLLDAAVYSPEEMAERWPSCRRAGASLRSAASHPSPHRIDGSGSSLLTPWSIGILSG